MRERVHQVLKFMGLALAVVFLGPGVQLSPSQDGQI
jgi:hypothetical protein